MLRSLTVATVATLATSTGGCGPVTDPDTDVLRAGDAFVLVETEQFEGDVAGVGLSGTLALVDGCVGFESGLVILFPPGTGVSGADDDLVVEVDGHELRLGRVALIRASRRWIVDACRVLRC